MMTILSADKNMDHFSHILIDGGIYIILNFFCNNLEVSLKAHHIHTQ